MIIQNNVDLSKKTTFHIGGIAKKYYIPESEEELINIAKKIFEYEKKLHIIGGGSNLLINDKKVFPSVISFDKACNDMFLLKENQFYIGASVRIQQAIHYVNENGYGGFEELIGLPAMFGGIVYMNAGIGGEKKPLFAISDYIKNVRVYDLENSVIVNLSNDECNFGYRKSIFQNDKYVILGATLELKPINIDIAIEKITRRKEYCKNNFEYGNGCFGTCFSKSNPKILKVVSVLYSKFGNKEVLFSKKILTG